MMTMTQPAADPPVDPEWGDNYGCGEPAYVTPDGVQVWMYRKGQRVRYFDGDGTQVGPEHRNVAPAAYWAAASGWIDPTRPDLSVACIAEVRGQLKGDPVVHHTSGR
jgi:hypothetical protein